MACASCGGGRQLTSPSRPTPQYQSPQQIVVTPKTQAQGSGYAVHTNPNKPAPTKRTTV